ncbi:MULTISPECIES: hypothetical protein [Acinetobacter]|uniref:Uncharacterized protein n=2 Tax=Acinetobacter beijerinckii TaxID=262668 RepID=N9FUB0_9GAMM|nr:MULTISPECIES: hypothetical protein [Acinetobacter]ENW06382.1 hypothetical protein F933_02110 [Acinetobacter beijerinckii CIP 110307]ENW08501.1 hypothetical protein F934_00088 [Acinetobacter beijerinckii ANC 3835]UTO19279.1 hypothetical protein NGC85_15460 [Acinetobacter sp. Z1]
MRKIVYLILLLSLLWLAKLSYDVAQYSQIVPQIQQQLSQTEQRSALLNDQLVALQRQGQNADLNVENAKDVNTTINQTTLSPVLLVKQQLELVQFALDQQQFLYAIDHLNQAQQQVLKYAVSPALQQSLIKALEQDKQAIQQYVLAQTQQQQQLDNILQQLDQKLADEIQNPTIKIQKNENNAWWHWFKLEKVQRDSPDLINRGLVLKEAQLRLLLASQALHEGQMLEYKKSVQEVLQLLQGLPDRNTQQLKLRLEKLLNLPLQPAPKLTTLSLLG